MPLKKKYMPLYLMGASLLKLAILQFSQSNCGNSGSNYWLSLLYFLMSEINDVLFWASNNISGLEEPTKSKYSM